METLISIIVPFYNAASFIERCAESLFAQTYRRLELVFVNDASQDGSVDILKNVIERRFDSNCKARVIDNTHAKGPGGARQTGLCVATGDWCAFVDSDDWVEEDYISNLLIDDLKRGDLIVAGVLHDDESGSMSRRADLNPSVTSVADASSELLREIINDSYPFGKLFYRPLIVSNNLVCQEMSLHEDTAFVMEYLTVASRLVVISAADYHYVHRTSDSLTKKPRSAAELITISNVLFAKWQKFFAAYPKINAGSMRQCIQRYGLSQLLQAVLAIYSANGTDRQERLSVISTVRAKKETFEKYYRPSNLKIRVLLCLILYGHSLLVDGLLRGGMAVSRRMTGGVRLVK